VLEEVDEEDKEADKDQMSEHENGSMSRALPTKNEDAVIVRNSSNKIDTKLSNLHRSQILLPPKFAIERNGQVVVIHEDVHGSIQRNDDPLRGGLIVQPKPTEIRCDEMVERVQKCDGFLSQDEDVSVDELIELAEKEDVIPVVQVGLKLNTVRVAYESFHSSDSISLVEL